MAALSDILSAGLIEKDCNGDVLWTWSYPSVKEEQRELYIRNCGLLSDNSQLLPFIYSQWQRTWYYIHTCPVEEGDNLPKVTHFSLVITAKDFNPEKYEALCKIFTKQYRKSGNPANMLQSYLSVITKGTCNGEENGTFTVRSYDQRQAYANGSIRSIIETFGVETILIYTAVLLRKRLAVYHPKLQELLMFIRILPAFVWHRQDWSILFPFLSLESKDLDNLKSTTYIAGFTDAIVESRSELYDIFVSLADRQIEISPSSKESFAMGKLHKDMAMAMVQSVEDAEKSDQQIIKEISLKTKELLNNLKSLATKEEEDGKSYISLERLKARKMPPATENFLYTLAACEGLVKL